MDIDPGPNVTQFDPNNAADIFILKLKNNGDYVWGKQIGKNLKYYSC